MKSCDICGKETGDLYDLLELYRTTEIREVCDDCRKVLDAHKSKLHTVTSRILADWLKRFMVERRDRITGGRISINPPPRQPARQERSDQTGV